MIVETKFLFFLSNRRAQQPKNESVSLPSASYLLSGMSKGATTGHVFNNPYKDEENAKIASLEKHVKMVRVHLLVVLFDGQTYYHTVYIIITGKMLFYVKNDFKLSQCSRGGHRVRLFCL